MGARRHRRLERPPARPRQGGAARPPAAEPGPSARGLPVVRAVLAATLEALAEVGYGALTVEQVALRAGVNKTTVYRRWPGKAELVTAALDSGCAESPLPEAGDVRADLLALARRMAATLASPRGRGLLRTVVAGCADADLFALATAIRRRNEAPALALLARAVQRGDLRAEVDPAMLLHAVSGWLVHTVLRERAEVTEAQLSALVGLLLEGGVPRPLRRTGAPP